MIVSALRVPECDTGFKFFEDQFFTGVIGPVDDYTSDLVLEEGQLVSAAVCKRRQEFSTGRFFAKRALESMGADSTAPILMADRGRPVWPVGFVGSISHITDMCIVGIARRQHIQGIGLDIEIGRGLPPKLYEGVLTATEMKRMLTWEQAQPLASTLMFSAKESVYKAVYPLVGDLIDYNEMEIDLDFDQRAFSATYLGSMDGNRIADCGKGRFQTGNRFIVTSFVLP